MPIGCAAITFSYFFCLHTLHRGRLTGSLAHCAAVLAIPLPAGRHGGHRHATWWADRPVLGSSTILHHPPPPLVARAPMALLWFLWIRDHAFGLCLTILLPHCVACRFDRVARPQRHTGNSIVPIDPLSSSFYPHDTVFCTVTPPFHILISSFTCHRILVPSCRLSHPQQPTPPFPASALASFSFSLLYYASADKNTMPSWLCKKTSRRPYLRLWRGKKQETKTG